MSKMKCKCGHIISNVTYPAPTEGRILPQELFETLLREFCCRLGQFINADRSGLSARAKWLREGLGDGYPADTSIEDVINDLLTDALLPKTLSVAECEQCGRLHVQRAPQANEYLSYVPEDGAAAHLLSVTSLAGAASGSGKTALEEQTKLLPSELTPYVLPSELTPYAVPKM